MKPVPGPGELRARLAKPVMLALVVAAALWAVMFWALRELW